MFNSTTRFTQQNKTSKCITTASMATVMMVCEIKTTISKAVMVGLLQLLWFSCIVIYFFRSVFGNDLGKPDDDSSDSLYSVTSLTEKQT